MAETGYEIDINLDEGPVAWRAALVNSATRLPAEQLTRGGTNRAALGVKWCPPEDINVKSHPADCEAVNFEQGAAPARSEVVSAGFLLSVFQDAPARTHDLAGIRNRLDAHLTLRASALLTKEWMTAAGSGDLALTGGPGFTPSAFGSLPLADGIAALEQHAATRWVETGRAVSMIHMSVGHLTQAVAADLVAWDGDRFSTHNGLTVVADPGFQNVAPFTESVTANEQWIYATTEVWFALADPQVLDGDAQTLLRNEHRPRGLLYGVVTWDPQETAAVSVPAVWT